jgi:hypothetical protein
VKNSRRDRLFPTVRSRLLNNDSYVSRTAVGVRMSSFAQRGHHACKHLRWCGFDWTMAAPSPSHPTSEGRALSKYARRFQHHDRKMYSRCAPLATMIAEGARSGRVADRSIRSMRSSGYVPLPTPSDAGRFRRRSGIPRGKANETMRRAVPTASIDSAANWVMKCRAAKPLRRQESTKNLADTDGRASVGHLRCDTRWQ